MMTLTKPYTKQEYIDFIAWCNQHNCVPEDKGDFIDSIEILPTIEEARSYKIAELKQSRDKAERVPVVTSKGTFDVDSVSMERIRNALTVLKISGNSQEWTLADNTVVSVTADDLTDVIVALAQQSNYVHHQYILLKDQVASCMTLEDIDNIVWSQDKEGK